MSDIGDVENDNVDPTDPYAFANLPMALQAYNKAGGGTSPVTLQPERAEQLPPEETVAPAPVSKGAGIGGVGDFGQGHIQQQLEGLSSTQLVSQEQQQQIDADVATRRGHAQEGVSEINKVNAQLIGLQATQETLNKARLNAETYAQNKLTKAAQRAQYPSLSIPEIEQLQTVADDDTGKYNDQQKRAAQLSLKRASTVDPNRLLGSSAGNRILAIVAQVLGAMGTGLSGGRMPNFGLQAVNEAIDRDILSQKEEFDSGERAYSRQKSLYADLRTHFDSESQAIAAQRSMLLTVAASTMDKYKLQDGADQLRQQAIMQQAKVKQEQVSTTINSLGHAGALAESRQRGALENKKLDIIAEKSSGQNAANIPGGAIAIPGEEAKVPKLGATSPAHKLMESYNSTIPILNDLIAARGKYGAELLNRYGVADMRGMHAYLETQLIGALGLSRRINDKEKDILANLASADPSHPAPVLEALTTLRANLRNATRGKLKTYHLDLDEAEPK